MKEFVIVSGFGCGDQILICLKENLSIKYWCLLMHVMQFKRQCETNDLLQDLLRRNKSKLTHKCATDYKFSTLLLKQSYSLQTNDTFK